MAGKDKVSTLDTTSSSVSSFIDGQVNKLNSQPPANNYISSNAPSSISYSSATFNHQQQHNNHCIQQQQQQQSDINCEKSLLFQSSRNVFKEITRSNPIYSFKSNAISSPSKRPPPQAPPKTWRARCNNYLLSLRKPQTLAALWNDSKFLINFFYYLSPRERCIMAQVSQHISLSHSFSLHFFLSFLLSPSPLSLNRFIYRFLSIFFFIILL